MRMQWISGAGQSLVPQFDNHQGTWRPDFLIGGFSGEEVAAGHENFRICEINARFPYNAFFVSAYAGRGYLVLDPAKAGLHTTCTAEVSCVTFCLMLFQLYKRC
jgi:hypothetical protein